MLWDRIHPVAYKPVGGCFISAIVGWRRISADLLADSAAVQALLGHPLADQRISSSRARNLYTLPWNTDCFYFKEVYVLLIWGGTCRRTPLQCAAYGGYVNCMSALIEHGACPNLCDREVRLDGQSFIYFWYLMNLLHCLIIEHWDLWVPDDVLWCRSRL